MKQRRIEDAKGVEMGSAMPVGLLPPSPICPSTYSELCLSRHAYYRLGLFHYNLFVCFSFPLLVNSSQWERRQRREKLKMGHKSHQALVQLESASASPPPPLPRQRGIQHKSLLP